MFSAYTTIPLNSVFEACLLILSGERCRRHELTEEERQTLTPYLYYYKLPVTHFYVLAEVTLLYRSYKHLC